MSAPNPPRAAPIDEPDLFSPPPASPLAHFEEAFAQWLATRQSAALLRENSSVAVYAAMWSALAQWCVARELSPGQLDQGVLLAYLDSRVGLDGEAALSDRYAWRLLTLVDSVLVHHASGQRGAGPNRSALALLHSRPEWRYANAADRTPAPECLDGADAARLVAWLMQPTTEWQPLRNRAATGLQLGAGLTPADVRALQVTSVRSGAVRVGALPFALRIPAHGASDEREAPLARWAGRLLRDWLDTRARLEVPGPWLFPSTRTGKPWSKVAQYSAARQVLTDAGLPDAAGGSFVLRHTFAVRQLQRGASEADVAAWLGLADTAPLKRYRDLAAVPPDIA